MENASRLITEGKTVLGIELGSTRIRAVLIDRQGNICFLQAIIPKSCIQKWRKLHLHFGENCRLPGRVAKALHRQHCRHITDSVIAL